MKAHSPTRLLLVLAATNAIAATVPGPALGQNWKDRLKSELETIYSKSKRAALSPDRITEQGVVLIVRKEGIAADLSSDIRYSVTHVRAGQVGEAGGVATALFSKENTRVFKPGERVYVTDIKIHDNDVMLMLLSVEMFDVVVKGSGKQTRYKAALKFEFPENYLTAANSDEVRRAIDDVVATEEIAATSTKTIALGQTRAEVESILGKPPTILDLGEKLVYVYTDMKITFRDGKVTDIQ